MSPRAKRIAVAVLAVAALALLWNLAVYAPAGDDLDAARERVERAEIENRALRAERAVLEQLATDGAATQQRITELDAKIPSSAGLDVFLREADSISEAAGVELLGVTPSPVQDGAAGLGEIRITMQLRGRFRQVLDYLRRLETGARLVVVDAIEMSAESADGTVSGGPPLSTTVQARLFVQSGAGAADATGSAGPTDGSTDAANGTDAGGRDGGTSTSTTPGAQPAGTPGATS